MASNPNHYVTTLVCCFVICLHVVSSQKCLYSTTPEGTPSLTSGFFFLRPFVPSFFDTWTFQVKAEANVYIKLSSESYDVTSGDIYVVGLGVVSGTQVKSSIFRIMPGTTSAVTILEATHPSGLLTVDDYDEFFIRITSNGIIRVGRSDESANPFLTGYVGLGLFQEIKYVGVKTVGNSGMWQFCIDNAQSLRLLSENGLANKSGPLQTNFPAALAVDGNAQNDNVMLCVDTGIESNPWWRVDLGKVYDIALVEIINPLSSNSLAATLQKAEVLVGSCEGSINFIKFNSPCSTPISYNEAISDYQVLRKCPTNSFGQFVYITVPGDGKRIVLCEVKVYGREVAADSIPSLRFMSTDITSIEGDGEVAMLEVIRDGDTQSCSNIAISFVDGTAKIGQDYTLGTSQATFLPDQQQFALNIMLVNDDDHEEKERFSVQLRAAVGATLTDNTAVVLIKDDDDLFGFVTDQYSFHETVGSAEVFITRKGELEKDVTIIVTPYLVNLETALLASADIDYDSTRISAKFLRGRDRKASVKINITDDQEEEGNEVFRLRLAVSEGHGILDNQLKETFITIIDDETVQTTTNNPTIPRVFDCRNASCENGGSCEGRGDGEAYKCNCPEGFQGERCESIESQSGISAPIIIIVCACALGFVGVLLLVACCICFIRRKSTGRTRSPSSKPMVNENDYDVGHDANNRGIELQEHIPREKHPNEFPRSCIRLQGVIGTGAFGNVYKASAIGVIPGEAMALVAVKVLKGKASAIGVIPGEAMSLVAVKVLKDTDQQQQQTSEFMKELRFLESLDPHPNIVRLIGCCLDKVPYYLILEFAAGGNLREYLHSIRKGRGEQVLTPKQLIGYAFDVSKGMEYIASKNCIHRDLASRNILLTGEKVCKLSDFGLARDLEFRNQYQMKSDSRVPLRWMAPEAIEDNKYTIKTDVWSFGIMLWELVTMGAHPYGGMNSDSIIKMICSGRRLSKPEHCSDDMYRFMLKCWTGNPKKRPDFHDIRKQLELMLADATGYLKMKNLKKTSYVYLERKKWQKQTKDPVKTR